MTTGNYYKNKVVIITGSSMGIGKELARQVLIFGGKVVITGRNQERLEKVKVEFWQYVNNVLIHNGNVADFEDNIILVQKVISHFGKIDILINNAGLSGFCEIEKMNKDIAKQIIDTNIYGSLFPSIAALPELQKTKGSVLYVSSIAGFHGLPGYSTYSLSKMSLKALAQSLYVEMKNKNVFAGITYVGFTENEDEKKTLSPEGEWVDVPKRPKIFTSSRQRTALKILKQIKNKKHSKVHSLLGTITYRLSNFFPVLITEIIRKTHQPDK